MAKRINSSSDFYVKTQDDVFFDGDDGTTALKSTATVVVSRTQGLAATTTVVDGDLRAIGSAALMLDPAANNAGNALFGYTHSFLLRWLIKILQIAIARLPESLGQKNKANSLSVTLSSDHDPLTVDGTIGISNFPETQNTIEQYPDTAHVNIQALTSAIVVKATAARLFEISAANPGDSDAWLKIYNAAAPTIGETPVVDYLLVPAGAQVVKEYVRPIVLSEAMTLAATVSPHDSSNALAVTGLVVKGRYE